MNIQDLLAKTRTIVDTVKGFAPLAALGGPQLAAVAQLASAGVNVIETAIDGVNKGIVIAQATDIAKLQEMQTELQQHADDLAKQVDAS